MLDQLEPAERRAVAPAIKRCPRLALDAGSTAAPEELPAAEIFAVERGLVVVTSGRADRARRIVLEVAGRDRLVPRPQAGEELGALTEAELTAVTDEAYRSLLATHGGAAVVARCLTEGLLETRRNLAVVGHVSHTERVREKLVQLARAHGRVVPGGILLDVPLTHALVAAMIGSARETVSTAVSELAAAGFLSREGGIYRLALLPEDLAD